MSLAAAYRMFFRRFSRRTVRFVAVSLALSTGCFTPLLASVSVLLASVSVSIGLAESSEPQRFTCDAAGAASMLAYMESLGEHQAGHATRISRGQSRFDAVVSKYPKDELGKLAATDPEFRNELLDSARTYRDIVQSVLGELDAELSPLSSFLGRCELERIVGAEEARELQRRLTEITALLSTYRSTADALSEKVSRLEEAANRFEARPPSAP